MPSNVGRSEFGLLPDQSVLKLARESRVANAARRAFAPLS